jgi:L-ribulose-5-phosphate 3-epimerase
MNCLGMMQGRLVPPEEGALQRFPRSRWADEFDLAALVPLEYIEWIYDKHGADVNPLMEDDGINQLRHRIESTGVAIRSVCADYFMEYPFLRCPGSTEVLLRLLDRCQAIGVRRLVLPFVDNSAITASELGLATEFLQKAAARAHDAGVELHLEMSLQPRIFAELLCQLPESTVKVNYDSGNSASLGYRTDQEFAAIGTRIGSVHIKDRTLGGGTVPLGSGNADFDALYHHLREVRYSGDFTLQVARGKDGDEVNWARHNIEFVRRYWPAVKG